LLFKEFLILFSIKKNLAAFCYFHSTQVGMSILIIPLHVKFLHYNEPGIELLHQQNEWHRFFKIAIKNQILAYS